MFRWTVAPSRFTWFARSGDTLTFSSGKLATVKSAEWISVPLGFRSIAAVMLCEPFVSWNVEYGFAVPFVALPLKSCGAPVSVRNGVPAMVGSSR